MSATQNEIVIQLIDFIKENLLADNVDLEEQDSLTQLGLDSFSLIEILLFVERKFDTIVPIEALNREKTETVHAISKEVVHFMEKGE